MLLEVLIKSPIQQQLHPMPTQLQTTIQVPQQDTQCQLQQLQLEPSWDFVK